MLSMVLQLFLHLGDMQRVLVHLSESRDELLNSVTWVPISKGRGCTPSASPVPGMWVLQGGCFPTSPFVGVMQGDAVGNVPLKKTEAPMLPFDQTSLFQGKKTKTQRKIKTSVNLMHREMRRRDFDEAQLRLVCVP